MRKFFAMSCLAIMMAALARMWDGVAKSAAYLEAAEFTK